MIDQFFDLRLHFTVLKSHCKRRLKQAESFDGPKGDTQLSDNLMCDSRANAFIHVAAYRNDLKTKRVSLLIVFLFSLLVILTLPRSAISTERCICTVYRSCV